MAQVKIASEIMTKMDKCWKVRQSVSNAIFIPLSQITETKNGKMRLTSPIERVVDCKILVIKDWIYAQKECDLKKLGERFQIISR